MQQIDRSVELNQGLRFSLAVGVDPSGETYTVDWNNETGAWEIASREYEGRSWRVQSRLTESGIGSQAYEQLISSFGLDSEEFHLEDVVTMHPSLLVEHGRLDPQSFTLGDHRKASEVTRMQILVAV